MLKELRIKAMDDVLTILKLTKEEDFSLVCQTWLPVTFKVGKRIMKQALYICRKVQVIYFSKAACIDVGI